MHGAAQPFDLGGQPVPVRLPGSAALRVALASAAVFLVTLVDAMLHPPGPADLWLLRQTQRIDLPYLWEYLELSDRLTDSSGAVVAWGVALALFAGLRWWLPLLGVASLPVGGVINEGVGILLVRRTRPHDPSLRYGSENFEERSFPSGHVVGAVLLYGFVWFALGRVRNAAARRLARTACVLVIVTTAFDRLWGGAHWPTDVVGGFALGAALLALLVWAQGWAVRRGALGGWDVPLPAGRAVRLTLADGGRPLAVVPVAGGNPAPGPGADGRERLPWDGVDSA